MKISLVESVIHCEQNVFVCVQFKNDHGTHDKTTTTQMSIQKNETAARCPGHAGFQCASSLSHFVLFEDFYCIFTVSLLVSVYFV